MKILISIKINVERLNPERGTKIIWKHHNWIYMRTSLGWPILVEFWIKNSVRKTIARRLRDFRNLLETCFKGFLLEDILGKIDWREHLFESVKSRYFCYLRLVIDHLTLQWSLRIGQTKSTPSEKKNENL